MPATSFLLRFLFALLCALAPLSGRAAHPLITEDTGTQGQGNFQAELTNEQFTIEEDADKQKLALTTLTLGYGVVDSVDMIVRVPYLKPGASESDGTPGTQGMGDLGLDVKWRFHSDRRRCTRPRCRPVYLERQFRFQLCPGAVGISLACGLSAFQQHRK